GGVILNRRGGRNNASLQNLGIVGCAPPTRTEFHGIRADPGSGRRPRDRARDALREHSRDAVQYHCGQYPMIPSLAVALRDWALGPEELLIIGILVVCFHATRRHHTAP